MHPVGQIRQGIMSRQVRNLGFGMKPFGNVFMGRDPAASWDRMIDDDNGPAIGQPGQPLERFSLPDRRQQISK